MEKTLLDRDRFGVHDFILLEDFTNIDAFVDNLRRRFKENLIYTSIGQVLISVNPYKQLDIYGIEDIHHYRNAGFLDSAPHVYSVADTAYRSLTEENRGQCILISGESGAGKTEASKKVLQFVAAATGHKGRVEAVKDKLLVSNPVLEAFGNAKTNKNDNSSRFGKYMDIAFDYAGDPAGGNILNYLLEKSRVVYQSPGERNFHIFYQLLAGADDQLLSELGLVRERDVYCYLHNSTRDTSTSDAKQYQEVRSALTTMEMSNAEQLEILNIIGSVLHLGNVRFLVEEGLTQVEHMQPVAQIAKLLGCSAEALGRALTHRTIDAHSDVVTTHLTIEQSLYARDALAKAVYDRLFTWLVRRLNSSLEPPVRDTAVIGILDIYGFEVFEKNTFEQFCINLCNEKLQQLFIKLTLNQEQEEYIKEGIEWEQIEYFDNKVICDLIEERRKGIISMMDEECIRPGSPTDLTLLAKMNTNLSQHPHYIAHEHADTLTQKTMGRDEFRLKHYAGEVTYQINSFMDKNNDLLFRDLIEIMTTTSNSITKACFPTEELSSRKRPETAMSKFQLSLSQLMFILGNKEPSYIRCIRPNDDKAAGLFSGPIVKHQVKYLGLMENLRVRRAGFAYRRSYADFLERYKSLCPATWPNYRGDPRQGVQVLVNHLGYTADEYKMGKTKIFIRLPSTLFKTEDAFLLRKHEIAAIIQKVWRGRQQRLAYQKIRQAVISMERVVRGFLARRRVHRIRSAVHTIRRFIEGFITRNGPESDINIKFIRAAKVHWLLRLSKNLPTHLLDKSWPPCPAVCQQASSQLHEMHTRHLARKYRMKLSSEHKKRLQIKILAETLFRGKKKTYQDSFPKWFQTDRLLPEHKEFTKTFISNHVKDETIMYCSSVTKYDRHGYTPRPRVLLIGDKSVYLLDHKTGKQKHKLPHRYITEIVVTAGSDSMLLVRIPVDLVKEKGDIIVTAPHLIEAVTSFIDISGKPHTAVKIVTSGEILHNKKGKQGTIQVANGVIPSVAKGKGILKVEG